MIYLKDALYTRRCGRCAEIYRSTKEHSRVCEACNIQGQRFNGEFRNLAEILVTTVIRDYDTDCWNWDGEKRINGYGSLDYKGEKLLAHQASYETFIGKLPSSKKISHYCGNRLCINPIHLFVKSDTRVPTVNVNIAAAVIPAPPHQRTYKTGTANDNAKLDDDKVRLIRRMAKVTGVTYQTLASQYGVSKTTIGHIVRRKKWKHVI